MKLLAIDTATEACSVALWFDGEIIENFVVAGREHSVMLPKLVPAILAEAGLSLSQMDGLVCGVGPGSFAGVRIGVSYVKGLALGLDRAVIGVTSLAMLAQAALAKKNAGCIALPAIDARMNEVYFGIYHSVDGLAASIAADCVCPPETITVESTDPLVAIGSGWQAHGPALESRLPRKPEGIDGTALPHAGDALILAAAGFSAGLATDAADLVPVYLRNRVALTKIEQAAQRATLAASKGNS